MPSKAVADAFEAKIGNPWNGLPLAGLAHTSGEPPANTNGFVVLQYPVSNAEKPTLGGRYFEEGAARVVLNVTLNVGLAQALTWADTLAALLRTTKFGGVETFAPSAPIIDDTIYDGLYVSVAVIVPYRFQFDA